MADYAKRVLVIGGGFSGMATAIAMRKKNISVDLVEIDPQWRVQGAGISLGGATLRAFQDLGILDAFLEQGYAGEGTELYTPDGHHIRTLPTPSLTGTSTPGNGAVMRPILARIMERATREVGGVDIRLGCTFSKIEQDADSVTVEFTDGEVRSYDLVVGADGVFSKVRETYFPDVPGPGYSGQSVWRAVLPRPEQITTTRIWAGEHTKVGVNPVNNDKLYLFVNEFRPEKDILEPETYVESLSALMAPFTDPLVQEMRAQLEREDAEILFRPLEGMLVQSPWYRGRILLIGDAVHATTPHLGSGACIGIEDGLVLAEEIAEKPLDQALAGFMGRRWERCRMVVENSKRLGEIEIQGGDKAEHARIMAESFAALAQPI